MLENLWLDPLACKYVNLKAIKYVLIKMTLSYLFSLSIKQNKKNIIYIIPVVIYNTPCFLSLRLNW